MNAGQTLEPDWKREPCPACKRKGLHYASHAHATGWKDTSIIVCRFCNKRFDRNKLRQWLENQRNNKGD